MVKLKHNQTVILNNGQNFPLLGLGTVKYKDGESCQIVKDAIDIGYRHFDTATLYLNEDEVGQAINDKIKENVIKRSDVFVTTKIWVNEMQPENVIPALKKSLNRLNLDFVDMYLIHWPAVYKSNAQLSVWEFPSKAANPDFYDYTCDFLDTWTGMEKCVELGLTKGIGISNFNSKQIMRILDHCQIPPAINQVECHPYYQQEKLYKFCQENGQVLMTGYSPIGSPDWDVKPGQKLLIDDEVLKKIGQKYGKTGPQIALRWGIEKNIPCIPRTKSKSRAIENFNIWDFELSDEDHELIQKLQKKDRLHFNRGLPGYELHKDYPFTIEF